MGFDYLPEVNRQKDLLAYRYRSQNFLTGQPADKFPLILCTVLEPEAHCLPYEFWRKPVQKNYWVGFPQNLPRHVLLGTRKG